LNRGISNSFTDYLISKGFFKYLGSDIQRVKNVLKFLKIIYYLEKKGKTIFEIAFELRRLENVESEPRANIFSEGMNAVRILTIHRAKGLEFPIVFVPELDSIKTRRQDVFAYDEDEKGYMFKIYPSGKKEVEFKFYKEYIERLKQEEKRILYVALTRARDGLVISGKFDFKKASSPSKNAFQYVLYNAGVVKQGETYKTEEVFENIRIIKSDEIEDRATAEQEEQSKKQRIEFEREIYIPEKIVYKSVKDYYAIIFGEVVHTIFDAVSKNLIKEDKIYQFAENLLLIKKIDKQMRADFIKEIKNQIKVLKQKSIWDKVVLPKENSFSEIEFIYKEKGVLCKVRIDRLILRQNSAELYDYKISLKEQDEKTKEKIVRESIAQMQNYIKAVKEYFRVDNVNSFLIFTKDGEMVSV
jgi:ATP-dependent exoDNAse (exonuclease V) beta subunit